MLDVNPNTGSIKINGHDRVIIQERLTDGQSEVRIDTIVDRISEQTKAHCALDVIDVLDDRITLDEVGGLLHITRERVRQIQDQALQRIEFSDTDTGSTLKGLLSDDDDTE